MAAWIALAVFCSVVEPAAAQLGTPGSQIFERGTAGLPGGNPYDEFGRALAAGDFNGDGWDDLAVGTPHETVGGVIQCGALTILFGTPAGLTGFNSQYWTMNEFAGTFAEETDAFAYSLAVGDFDADGHDDLAIGVPGYDVETADLVLHPSAGAALVLYGSDVGLLAGGYQLWRQGHDGIDGVPEDYNELGGALAAGDFDGDGFDDLAIGVTHEDIGDLSGVGAVNLVYGSIVGLTTTPLASPNEIWTQGELGISEDEEGDHFGYPLVAGDFNADGRDDLAIGAVQEGLNATPYVGAVFVTYGTATGIQAAGAQVFFESDAGIPGTSETGDMFGFALAAGDFDGDGDDDLAIGSFGESPVGSEDENAGMVYMLRGIAGAGIGTNAMAAIRRGDVGDPEEAEVSFGKALAAGNFDGGDGIELAIGAPSTTVAGGWAAGAVHVLTGPGFAPPSLAQTFSQDGAVPGVAEELDYFGAALATGDFDGDGFDDLAIGVPEENIPLQSDVGVVNVIYSQGLFRDGFERGDTTRWGAGAP